MRMLFLPGEITMREHCFDRIEPLIKHPANPLLGPEQEWEGAGVYYPSVLYSEAQGIFRMWYFTSVGEFKKHPPLRPLIDNAEINGQFFVCYAQSKDGVKWERPSLGKISIRGSSRNNVVMSDSGFFLGCPTVIDDLGDQDPRRRYKMLIYDNDGEGRDGVRTAVSSDGIDWEFVGEFPVLPSQDAPGLWHNRRKGEYVAFLKDRLDNRRARLISTSRDFATWSQPAVCMAPDQGDSPTMHFYAQCAFHHCGHDLGFLGRYDLSVQKGDLELISSPQGNDWRRLPTRPQILATGDPSDWDGGFVTPGLGEPIVVGDRCYCYYSGYTGRHDEGGGRGSIGLATFSHGRLAGQQFEGEGWFSSMPLLCPGGALSLNAIAKEPMTVEVHSCGYGSAIKGYTRNECTAVKGDDTRHSIRWASRDALDEIRDRFIVLRVYGKNSIVYGARFGE